MSESRQYVILGVLGRGGFGTVYLAELLAAAGYKKRVALKLINADAPNFAEVARRTRDEARVLALLRHKSMVHVEGLAHLSAGWAVVLEYVEGLDLAGLLNQVASVPARPAAQIVAEIAGALHVGLTTVGPDGAPLGLLHRDIKPANIRLTPFGEVKLLDFGTARAEFGEREASTRSIAFGTPGYLAPERLEFTDGAEADVFALGVVLYEMITGARFGQTGGNPVKHEARLLTATAAARDATGGQADALVDLMVEMLAFDPAGRPAPRDVERRAERIAAELPGEPLRDWAEHTLPALSPMNQPSTDDPLVGTTLIEVPGPPTSVPLPVATPAPAPAPVTQPPLIGAPEPPGPAAAPEPEPDVLTAPNRRIAVALIVGAALMLLFIGVAVAAFALLRPAPAPPPLPPVAVCPSALPDPGQTCEDAPETCRFTVATSCGDRDAVASCASGAWAVEIDPCPETCPEAAPEDGFPCASPAMACEYTATQSCGAMPVHASCSEEGEWSVIEEPCPGRRSTCPSKAPADGSKCSREKERCTYTVSTSCGAQKKKATCVSGRWSAPEPDCSKVSAAASTGAATSATVRLEGDVSAQLRSGAGAALPVGSVPAGRYTVWADFGAGLSATDLVLSLGAGDAVTVRCSKMMARCTRK